MILITVATSTSIWYFNKRSLLDAPSKISTPWTIHTSRFMPCGEEQPRPCLDDHFTLVSVKTSHQRLLSTTPMSTTLSASTKCATNGKHHKDSRIADVISTPQEISLVYCKESSPSPLTSASSAQLTCRCSTRVIHARHPPVAYCLTPLSNRFWSSQTSLSFHELCIRRPSHITDYWPCWRQRGRCLCR